jgi:8-oxo-dGTP pyrophosphatase MutT (NUDIX family)
MYKLYNTIRYYTGYPSIYEVTHPETGIQITFSSGISDDVITKVAESFSQPNSKFNKWYFKCIENNIDIRSVKIDAVTMFGPNIGFLYLTADSRVIKNKETEEMQQLPGVTFIRGDAVCCLFVIKNTTYDTYNMVLVEQARVPISQRCLETPAGMLDGSNQFGGTMVKEIKEETKIDISGHAFMTKHQVENTCKLPFHTLMELGEFIPSQGGCDERLKVFAYVCEKTQKEIEEINDRITGEASEHEHIIVKVQNLTWENIDATNDSKLLVAASKFDRSFPNIIRKY